ncbi:hypothetical protein BDZ97DRAFT_1936181 [Flammula alnicola]|nr:hypothetical protein BDZ97DRAFT_1936181 [Flammula alnicola]
MVEEDKEGEETDYEARWITQTKSKSGGLAESGLVRRRRNTRPESSSSSPFLPLGWLSPSPIPKAVLLSTDTHHLFYLLMRLEALGFEIGSLDVHIESPSRPMSYANIYPERKDPETLSLASFRSSFSMVSRISLGGNWWTRSDPPGIDAQLKYIYSCFTKLPALSISSPGQKAITELIEQSPNQNAVPLDVFKNLQRLECENIDPRTLLGWDRLAESLKSLKIKKSGLEDITELFVGAVLDDQVRKHGGSIQQRQRNTLRGFTAISSAQSSPLPATTEEDSHGDEELGLAEENPSLPTQLSSSKWASLKHLYLPDNGLTFFPADLLPYLTSLTHLDLSSNLFVSVPPGLGELYNLLSLNLADNLIDSVLGIYLNLGQILSLNLSHNRLESLCGLERLLALERVDLRHNLLEESSEIGRLAVLPNISELWLEGNPFVEIEDAYRVNCFDYFWREGKTVSLDGTLPTLYERRSLSPPEQITPIFPLPTSSSTPVIAIEPSHNSVADIPLDPNLPEEITSTASPHLVSDSASAIIGGRRHKKPKRIVDLDANHNDHALPPGSHLRLGSGHPPSQQDVATSLENSHQPPSPASFVRKADDENSNIIPSSQRSRHSRYQTEFAHPSPSLSSVHEHRSLDRPQQTPLLGTGGRPDFNTLSSRSEARRARMSASVFEQAVSNEESVASHDNVDAYRKTIESLKKDMGDSWLKVYNQTQSS